MTAMTAITDTPGTHAGAESTSVAAGYARTVTPLPCAGAGA